MSKTTKSLSVSLVILALMSCTNADDQPEVAHYRFIRQITAYHEDGGVSYQDFVALAGVTDYSEGRVRLNLMSESGGDTVEVTVRSESDKLIFSVGGVETLGDRNRWVRLEKPDSNTFGSDTECEVWIGKFVPPTTDAREGALPGTQHSAG